MSDKPLTPEQEQEVQEVFKTLSNMTNRMSQPQMNRLADLIRTDHRTLQQSFMREFVWPLINGWAEDYNQNRYDARNHDTVKTSFDIITAFSNPPRGFRFI